MWLDRGACLGGDIHRSRDVSYKRKPTIPRSRVNVSHKRNSWCKTSEPGTRRLGQGINRRPRKRRDKNNQQEERGGGPGRRAAGRDRARE